MTHCSGNPCRIASNKAAATRWKKLEIGPDNIHRRINGIHRQILLPKKYHRLVYKELHEEMGHLGSDKVVGLADNDSTGPICKPT